MMVVPVLAARLDAAPTMAAQLLSLLLCLALSSVAGFSVDSNQPIVFQSSDQGFGYQVVQMDKWVIVSAPLHRPAINRTGQLYQCNPDTRRCQPILIPGSEEDVDMSLGLSLATNNDASQLLACGPTVQRVCGKNIYVNGRCYQLNNRFQVQKTLPHEQPECNVFNLDIVMVIDGSGSINPSDFRLMLNFVSTVMEAFKDKDTRFALMQYSHLFQTHFDFNQFASSRNPRDLVETVKQLGGQTRTSSAILKALNELFTPQAGSRDGAQKLLIVITDGKTIGETPRYREAIGLAERMGVLRFVIGVGNAFNDPSAYQELVAIASLPTNEHIMRVDDFSALTKLQGDLESKIFAIEGTQSQSGSSFQMEMAQQGFSAILSQEDTFLGAVGAYDWSGGALIFSSDESSAWINATQANTDMKDSYLGQRRYTWTDPMENDMIAIGAPRYQHTGSVLIFQRNRRSSEWIRRATARGDKIGSYFGAALSMVKLTSRRTKTLLLVGAPTYYSPEFPGGLVYLCKMGHNQPTSLLCSDTLHGDKAQSLGHFGSAISVLPDLTGDQLQDLAVGAPCEDDNRGALYIFAGHPDGFRPSYIQRIAGRQVAQALTLFSRSLSGNLDMTNDGLPDLAVGSEGQVLVMRTRPVIGISVSMSFRPPLISLSYFECPDAKDIGKELKFDVCINTVKKSPQYRDPVSAELKYTVTLDSGRTQIRAQFENSGQSEDKILRLREREMCSEHSYKLPECVEDSLSPLLVSLNFSVSGVPVLSEDSPSRYVGQVKFQRNCGNDAQCLDDLRIKTFLGSEGSIQLVVGVSLDLNLTISVQNYGDDSFNTRVLISYPPGLSYARVTVVQSNKRVGVSCKPVDQDSQVICDINKPLLRPNTTVLFVVGFHVSDTADLGDTLSMTANVTSDNNHTVTDLMRSKAQLKVVYGIYVTITSLEESTRHTNFSSRELNEKSSTRPVEHIYRVNNLGQYALPLSVFFRIPVKLKGVPLWEKVQIKSSEPGPSNCTETEEVSASENSEDLLKSHPILDCTVATCAHFICNVSNMEVRTEITFTVSGQVTGQWAQQTPQTKLSLQSAAQILYDSQRYQHILGQNERFDRAQTQTALEVVTEYNYLPIIVGSSIGGLVVLALIATGLYKLGFFKRQYKQMMDGPEAETTTADMPPQDAQETSAPA